ncbi:Myblike DNAbinding domain-containing protein [Haplosporangium sp. Z 27]|nr:Myblike DNAbinding domain-containing protein [Haplosporangium sp. Z 27]
MLMQRRFQFCREFHSFSPSLHITASIAIFTLKSNRSVPWKHFNGTILTPRTRSSVLIESRNRFSTLISLNQPSQAIASAPKVITESLDTPISSNRSYYQKPLPITRASHKRTDDPWTKQDDELLFDLRQQGMPWKKISPIIKRPVGSCYSRYYRFLDPFLSDAIEDDPEEEELTRDAVYAAQKILEANIRPGVLLRSKEMSGLPIPYTVQGPWTAKDREKLELLVSSKTPWSVIARELQRNQESCKEKWSRIRKGRLEKKRNSKRVTGDQWNRLFKEGFSPYHRDQLVLAVENQLSEKRSQMAHTNDLLGLFELEDSQSDGGAFAMIMGHQPQDEKATSNDNDKSSSQRMNNETIDWDAIALELNGKFPAQRLKSIYHELAATKLVWTPEEDDRLIRAVIRLGPPELQPNIWIMIKDAFGDVLRTSEDYKDRWRLLDMPTLERKWDDSEKVKFWRRWTELQSESSLFSHPSFSGVKLETEAEGNSTDLDSSSSAPFTSNQASNEKMWNIIAEGLEYRHGRDCQIYFEQMTANFPKDPELFRYLTQEVANAYIKPHKVSWTPKDTRMLIATVNSFQHANKVVNWDEVSKSLGYEFTTEQCESRWRYWSQRQQLGHLESRDVKEDLIEKKVETASDSSDAISTDMQIWTDRELELLARGVKEHGHNWAGIRDKFLPHRTTQMIHERYWRSQAKKTGRFSEQERSLLEMAVENFGEGANWKLIASHVPGRTANQCRLNWNYGRTHHIQKLGDPWTNEDRERLKEAVEKFGEKWSLISEFVVGKTPAQCRHEWREKLDPKVKTGPWSGKELDHLMERVETIMSRKEEEEKNEVAKAMGKSKEGSTTNNISINEIAPRFKGKRRVNWKEVAEGIEGRTPQQCRLRFNVHRKLYFIQGDF